MTNYHTHTFRCRHAEGDVADYVRMARIAGLSELGFSDHVPFPDGLWPESRMDFSEISAYMESISEAATAEQLRGADAIRILTAFECELRPGMEEYLRDLAAERNLDYLVGAVHWISSGGEWLPATHLTRPRELCIFSEATVRTIRSGLFAFIAHPDIYCARWREWDADARACAVDILEAAAETRTPLEINGYGLRKPLVHSADGHRPQYPYLRFWELAADYGIEVMINSDAHRPVDVAASLREARSIAAACGLRVREQLDPVTMRSHSRP
ncbi:MAG TPA: histidinol phosphatase [Treponema sp.]|nr:MAG: hypothetical protein A2Y36_04110 [Treponema sp. GWA1_62_8]OHE68671.1 MAG: hypothetical protein A2001_06085 [Treponema sp. GWC1_61_84]OHE70352.1 MAG: hypothetical protein A2413_15060 [Treponema sp. RIFOXYC1_FULL_61_9]HCM26625.1 histidinol phosphatase [Treponema sp.]